MFEELGRDTSDAPKGDVLERADSDGVRCGELSLGNLHRASGIRVGHPYWDTKPLLRRDWEGDREAESRWARKCPLDTADWDVRKTGASPRASKGEMLKKRENVRHYEGMAVYG